MATLKSLDSAVHSKKTKHVEILQLAADVSTLTNVFTETEFLSVLASERISSDWKLFIIFIKTLFVFRRYDCQVLLCDDVNTANRGRY